MRVLHRFSGMWDEVQNRGGVQDMRNIEGGRWDTPLVGIWDHNLEAT